MNDVLAKKYVKALISERDIAQINFLVVELEMIAKVFVEEKFNAIIESPEVSNKNKVDLILSMIKKDNKTLMNFISLLGEKKRLELIPEIVKQVKKELSILNNSYTGVVYSNEKLSTEYVKSIEEKFSKKFNIDLILVQNIGNYDGIKVDIDGLGIEISFSNERFKSQFIDHVLKAV